MDRLSEQRKGEWYVLSHSALWGLFPIFTVLSYATMPSLSSYAWSSLFALLFFGIFVAFRRKSSELFSLQLWKYILPAVLFIGVLYYGLFFVGLTYTTPGNAAIIAMFEIFTSFVLFHLIRREHISYTHILGSGLMVIGAIIILGRNFSGINVGDVLILAATICAPIGNLYQQRARKIASSEAIMLLRTLATIPIVFAVAYLMNMHISLEDPGASLLFVVINGILLLGLAKLLWIEAIHRISVMKAIALSSLTPFLTLLFAWIILNQVPTVWQILSLVPFVLGVLLLTDQIRFRKG
ncbi:hypothetical protein A3A39_00995 [Candidatus Kaiserbacteria bacterium RIFCSPLOWO2_01_FULL_54_13]|uniref:EamA domain-containing protein n=1 Tax=Candidatus Kaiserbacteria bacterium RIFCSPLOWO2_01_FULL_54_13 TaxID=1798512 RepID=A0A1F6F265_9BACT|nr:MAG: hypothetical protein A3A39_00995 [Candidatus Kaiserbacteria bacterium RIFCSPLOWO2_01_FULL_54_13]